MVFRGLSNYWRRVWPFKRFGYRSKNVVSRVTKSIASHLTQALKTMFAYCILTLHLILVNQIFQWLQLLMKTLINPLNVSSLVGVKKYMLQGNFQIVFNFVFWILISYSLCQYEQDLRLGPNILQWTNVKIDDQKCHQNHKDAFNEQKIICAGEKVICFIKKSIITLEFNLI